MSKAKINYIIDVVIGLGFIAAALSGIILFFAPSGYQGGRNPYYLQPVLLLSTHTWNTLHTWSSMAMIAGVGAHLVLHWEWMVCMTKKILTRKRPSTLLQEETAACPID
jgi:hypothetical protein